MSTPFQTSEAPAPVKAAITGTSIIYDGRSSDTTYYLQVSAVNQAGEGPRSAEIKVSTEAGGALDPRLLAALTLLLLVRRRPHVMQALLHRIRPRS